MNQILSKFLFFYFKGSQFLSNLSKTIFERSRVRKRNEYFNNSLCQYADLTNYIDLLEDSNKLNPLRTNITIQPDILGGNTQTTLRTYGKPDFVFTENNLKIFLYARQFNDLKIRYEIHLYNDKVFSINYIYRLLDADDKNHIIKTTTAKYICRKLDDINIYNTRIVDKNNDMVFFDEFTVGLRITYLAGMESGWYAGMVNEINIKNAVKIVNLPRSNALQLPSITTQKRLKGM